MGNTAMQAKPFMSCVLHLLTVATAMHSAAGLPSRSFGHALRQSVADNSRATASAAMLSRRRLMHGSSEMSNGADGDVMPAPASIGTDVPLSFAGAL